MKAFVFGAEMTRRRKRGKTEPLVGALRLLLLEVSSGRLDEGVLLALPGVRGDEDPGGEGWEDDVLDELNDSSRKDGELGLNP